MKSSLPIFTIHLISISVIVLAVLTPCNGFAQLVPNITTQPQNQSVMVSSNATFTVVASGQSPLSYQWSFAGTNLTNSAHISGVTASTLTISNVAVGDAGNYQAIVSNRHGIATSSNATLTVFVPPTITTQPTNRVVFLGSTTIFYATGTGTEPMSYQWQKDGTNLVDGGRINGATDVALTISNIQVGDVGGYHLVVSNAYGVATSAEVSLLIIPVVAWGHNFSGQTNVPFTSTNALAITAGSAHGLALKGDGTVTSWGNNEYGQATPPQALTNVIALSADYYHSLALRNDGVLIGWGLNVSGVLTPPPGLADVVAVASGVYHTLALKRDGTVVGWGNNNTYGQATPPAGLSNVIAISARAEHSLALRNDGTVVGWGDNSSAQAIPPAGLSNVVAISTGFSHSLALRSNGTVAGWGQGYYGPGQPPAGLSNVVAIAAGGNHGLALRSDGIVVGWGFNFSGQASPPLGLTNVVEIAAGDSYSMALVENLGAQVPPTIWWQSPNRIVSEGQTTIFKSSVKGSLPMKFQWRFNGTPLAGETNSWLALTSIQTNQAGAYQFVVTNRYGMVTSDVATLTVLLAPPTFVQQPQSQTNVVSSNVTFSASVSGSSPLSYQWFFNDAPLTNEIATSLFIPNVQTNNAGSYWLVVLNAAGVITSSVATLTVLVPPSFTLEPTNQKLIGGLNASLTAEATGTGPLAYQWYRGTTKLTNDARLIGTASNILNISNVQSSDAGDYTIVVTNSASSITSAIAIITVVVPPAITLQPKSRSVPLGLVTIFNAAASGTAPLSFQWILNGTSIPGATSGSYTNWAVTPADVGAYELVVTNEGGAVTSSVALLTIGPVAAWGNNSSGQALPPPSLSNVVALAGGSTFSLALKGDGGIAAWGSGAGTNVPVGLSNVVAIAAGETFGLAMRADGTLATWGTSAGTNIPATTTNILAITGSSSHGLALRREGLVIEWGTNLTSPAPPREMFRVNRMSDGNGFSVAARTDGSVIQWGNFFGTTKLGNDFSVVPGLSNVVSVAAGRSCIVVLKSDGRIVSYGTGIQTNLSPLLTNTNIVFLTAAIAATSLDVSGGHCLALVSNSLNGRVVGWGNNVYGQAGTPGGLSNVVVVAVGAYHSLALVSDGAPLIIGQPVGGTAFSGAQFTLSATVKGEAPLGYSWSLNGTNIPNATNSSFVISNAQPTTAGLYQLTASNALGMAASVPVPVAVVNSAPFIFSIPTNRTVYFANLSIETIVAGSEPMQFQWQLNGANIPGATNKNLFIAGTNVGAGTYTFIANNVFGSAISNVVVKVVPGPVVAWGSSSSPTNVPASASNAIAIAAGYWVNGSDIALKADGTIVSWNSAGNINLPAGLSNVMEIASGYYPSNGLALKTNGTVTGWGNVNSTFLNTLSNVVSVEMHDGGSTFLRTDGSVSRLNFNGITNQPGLSNVVLLAPFNYGYLALRADGTVFMDSQGFGPVPTSNNVMAMAAGGYRAGQGLVLRRDGSLVTWGQPTNLPPIGPNCLGVAASSYGKFAIRSDGTVAAWSASSADASTNLPAGLANVSVIDAGEQHAIALLTDRNFPPVYLSDALNTPALVVSSKGSSQWFGQTNVNHDGLHAAQSGPVGSGTASSMRMWVTGPITVSFWWKVSSETNHDFLTFSAGGVILTNISGETGWRQCTLATPPGNQILQWTYSKDGNLSAGQDSAWVDQLVITPIAPSILTQPVGTNVLGGNNVAFNVSATGTPPLSYRWRKDAATIPGNVTASLALLNVTRSNSGIYSVVITNIAGSTTSSNATLRVLVPQLLSKPILQPDGTIMFNSVDADGGMLSPADLANLQVQASSNLVDWVSLSGALTLTNGALQLQDADSTNFPARYYRIVEQ